ncbi:hypothetical protein DJ568_06180 [Mucilaginibacter hurinus]|uniref:Phage holin family protein n=1 Tax=Mucilaginibacter hurinus TaxID=2201324 RepID=A0A367GQY0_9SPHI|nr:phage holin family protein [Mucilaginibacter hurinus]RCH55478.1 hypothetical protein DJ568_06180 [Mucilaginibacter hurinus]
MEEQKETTQSVIDQLKEYVETRITLIKYKAIEQSTSAVASVIVLLVISIVGLITFIFLNLTLALYLAEVLGSYWQGFGIVTAFYLLIVIILLAAKPSIEKPIVNSFIKKIFKS